MEFTVQTTCRNPLAGIEVLWIVLPTLGRAARRISRNPLAGIEVLWIPDRRQRRTRSPGLCVVIPSRGWRCFG
jgi:hypothetical protein